MDSNTENQQGQMNRIQQGDCLIIRTDAIPVGAESKGEVARYVVAEGEHTGHAHVLDRPASIFKHNETMFFTIKEPTEITHQEHKALTIPPGTWQIERVKEYDYLSEMTRNVQD